MKHEALLKAALAGIMAAGTVTLGAQALAAGKADIGLCSNANDSCANTGACGANKGKNSCTHQGAKKMSKADCAKLAASDKATEHKFSPLAKTETK